MFSDLNRRLEEVKELQRRQGKLQGQLERARRSLETEHLRRSELAAKLNKEDRDVQKLEKMSLAALFYSVLGSKEEQLEKERQEYLAARLKHAQADHSVTSLEREVEDLQGELGRLGDVQAQYQSILSEKETLIAQANDQNTRKLLELSEELAEARAQKQEIVEALEAGRTALNGLAGVIDATQSASNWGVWDMLGGGLLATAVKHSRIDEARAAVQEVQQALRRFQSELADVNSSGQALSVDVSGLETFADYFFDGLIVDWIVQSKIDRSLENAVATNQKVQQILTRLDEQLQAAETRILRLQDERQRLVESA